MVPGWHFGWECGKQPSYGPELVDRRGKLWLNKNKEPKGTGLMFFFYQMLVGDAVDNIAGCHGVGPKKAFTLLEGCGSKKDAERAVRASYEAVYGDEWEVYLQENAKLLWMARELNEDGTPVYYEWSY
jgi:5'-3' exonuclease